MEWKAWDRDTLGTNIVSSISAWGAGLSNFVVGVVENWFWCG
jgi:hypothetical protein